MRGVKIIGTGHYLPPRVVTNHDLSKRLDTSDEWIKARTGISERRVVDEGSSTATLGARAVSNACADAGIEPGELDGIIVATCSPDTIFPATACWVQNELGIGGMPAFDVTAGCCGYLFALDVAVNWLAAGRASKLAVVCAEVFSKHLNWDDRRTCVLFGDGAGAAILTPGEDTDSGLLSAKWGSDGGLADILKLPAGGTRMPATHATIDESLHMVHMEGAKVFKHAVRAMTGGTLEVMAEAQVEASEVDVFIPHQANMRIMEATRERVGIDPANVFSVLDRYGNLGAASIPVAISEARAAGKLKDGDMLAMTACGTGMSWASALMRW